MQNEEPIEVGDVVRIREPRLLWRKKIPNIDGPWLVLGFVPSTGNAIIGDVETGELIRWSLINFPDGLISPVYLRKDTFLSAAKKALKK